MTAQFAENCLQQFTSTYLGGLVLVLLADEAKKDTDVPLQILFFSLNLFTVKKRRIQKTLTNDDCTEYANGKKAIEITAAAHVRLAFPHFPTILPLAWKMWEKVSERMEMVGGWLNRSSECWRSWHSMLLHICLQCSFGILGKLFWSFALPIVALHLPSAVGEMMSVCSIIRYGNQVTKRAEKTVAFSEIQSTVTENIIR